MEEFFESKGKLTEYHLNQYQPSKPRLAIYDIKDYFIKYSKKRRKQDDLSYFKIIWFKSCNGNYFIDLKRYELYENCIFVVKKDETQYFGRNLNHEGTLIYFNEEFFNSIKDVDLFFEKDINNTAYINPFCQLNYMDTIVFQDYLNLIKDELANQNDTFNEKSIINCFKMFLMHLKYLRNKFYIVNRPQIVHNKNGLLLIKFIQLVDEDYKKGLNVSEYAKIINISPRSLCNLTSKALEKSPSQIINERIISEAQKMLLNTNLSIKQIGYDLGFDDCSYFVKYFKKHTAMFPLDFRKKMTQLI